MSSAREKSAVGAARDRSAEFASVALDLFAQKGFAATSIQEIGKAAGVNAGLLYYYFQNKDDLFRSALEYAVRVAAQRYEALAQIEQDPRRRIDAWLETNRDSASLLTDFLLLAGDYRRSGLQLPGVDALIEDFYGREIEIIASAVRAGIETGSFRAVDSEAVALWVSTSLDGIAMSRLLRPKFDYVSAIDALRTSLFQVLRIT